MKGYLLDSDVLIDFFKKKPLALELIDQLSDKHTLVISILSVTELTSGWRPKEAAFFLPRLYKAFTVLPLSLEIAELAGRFRRTYKRKGFNLGIVDVVIAAQAVIFELELITRNKRHYPMKEVKVYKEYS